MDENSKEIVDLNENYVYNDMLARALVQLLPQEERPHITMWLEKLQSISGDEKTLTTRNDYTWLLLLAMQSGKIAEPFDELPPTKDLPPISDIMPPHLFREMFGSTERDLCWIDDLIADTNAATDDQGSPSNCIPPHKFLELQPKPINGVTCYFSPANFQRVSKLTGSEIQWYSGLASRNTSDNLLPHLIRQKSRGVRSIARWTETV